MPEIQLLAQPVAFKQSFGVHVDLGTLGDRAWYAWHCLPRTGRRGGPPFMNALEAEFDLPPTTLSRLFSGERKTVELKTLPKLAAALRVSEMWLFKGEGQAPTLTGRFTSRRDQFGLEADFEELGEKINAMGGDATALARPRNNFEAAAQTLIFQLSEEAIAAVAAEAKGLEDSKPPHHWGKRLQEVEQEKRALRAPKAERTKSAQKKEAAPRSTPKVLPKRRAS